MHTQVIGKLRYSRSFFNQTGSVSQNEHIDRNKEERNINVCQRTRKDSDDGLIQICTKTNERTIFKISKPESKMTIKN